MDPTKLPLQSSHALTATETVKFRQVGLLANLTLSCTFYVKHRDRCVVLGPPTGIFASLRCKSALEVNQVPLFELEDLVRHLLLLVRHLLLLAWHLFLLVRHLLLLENLEHYGAPTQGIPFVRCKI